MKPKLIITAVSCEAKLLEPEQVYTFLSGETYTQRLPKSIDVEIEISAVSHGNFSFLDGKTNEEVSAYFASVLFQKLKEIEIS